MRTTLTTSGTTGRTRRAPVTTTLAALCLAIPMVAAFGGTAFATTTDADTAPGNSAAAPGQIKKAADDAAAAALAAAAKPAGFIGPVASASTSGSNANTTSDPFTNTGGVTTGSNTTSYEVVNGRSGSPAVGGGQPSGDVMAPQPLSNADQNAGGANNGGNCGAYCSTRDGSPSLNGNGGGKQVGQPCAGCVGKADNKNPPGQAPDGSDHNKGYECDANHGIGRSNPAHTGCKTPPNTPKYDCKGHLLPNNHTAAECDSKKYDCKGHELPNNHTAAECSTKKYDCKGHELPNNHTAAECGGGGGGNFCPGTTKPMPASGNVADCNPPVLCPTAGTMGPVAAGCGPISGGGGGPGTTIVPNGSTPTPVEGTTPGPGTALPFTGDRTEMLATSALLMLLVGSGLMVATRKPKPALALV